MENKYCLITTTFDDEKLCDALIKILLDKRLVSCVQINKVNSFCH